MRVNIALAFAFFLSAQAAVADEFSCSYAAIDAYLKADWVKYARNNPVASTTEKVGLVPRHGICPPMEQGGMLESVDSFQLTPIDERTDAILIDTHQCGGGNKHGQYFLISRNGKCDLITDPEIGDMAFIADSMFAKSDTVTLKGIKWAKTDAHCCPSSEGTLDYNVKTRKYTFNIHKIGQR